MWCPECKKKSVWNEMSEWISDEYVYECDECGTRYNYRMQVIKSKKEKEIN